MIIQTWLDDMFKLGSALTRFLRYPLLFGIKAVHLLCVIVAPVASAQEAPPVVINLQTQQQVDLTRAYWNANVDIANRPVACDHFQFDSESAVYKSISGAGWPGGGLYLSSEVFTHTPLGRDAEGTVRSGNLQNWTSIWRTPTWNVYNGIYTGLAPFNSHEYIEVVNYDATTRLFNVAANNNAFRVWHSLDLVSPSTYSVCYDVDGTGLIPTGSASIGNTNLIDLVEVDFTFQFPQPLSGDEDAPVITRLDTGEQVEFVRGEWRYNDVPGMRCSTYRWASGRYETYGDNDGGEVLFITYYPFVGGATVATSTTSSSSYRNNGLPVTGTVRIEDFQFFDDGYMELVEDGFNLWRSEWPYGYTGCNVRPPNLVLPLQPDSCDYSTADQYDGYGWNPVTRESCPPLEATETETPVIDQPLVCIDSDGDGFGWNGVATCSPSEGEPAPVIDQPLSCIDTDGDGFGWNGVATCSPAEGEPAPVIDQSLTCTDTDGDGFGWNGVETCSPDEDESGLVVDQSVVCIDSNGDGFGWTGIQSCRFDEQGNIVIL